MSLYASLRENPFIRIIIPLITGIIIAFQYNTFFLNCLSIIKFIALLCASLTFFLILKKPELKLTDFFIHTTVFVLSLWLTLSNISIKNQNEFNKIVVGKIISEPITKQNSILLQIKQLNAKSKSIFKPKLNVYLKKDTQSVSMFQPGVIVGFNNKLQKIVNNGNPNEFDFVLFQQINRVYFQAFISRNDLIVLETGGDKITFTKSLLKIRKYVFKVVNSSINSSKTRQLVLALLIGDRSELDQETLQSFTNAGVVHILAISGLHVGIIYMFLLILMKFCDRNKSLKLLRTVIIVLVIWTYALLTGFSPSVSRAATMFTLFALGKLINRDVSVFNLIAASAFLNLLINPLLIFHVGFQLSYAAVAGIVFFVPLFNNYISFSHRIPDYFFKLFTVSLAAQIATFPISVYYFNQFPTYFWLSNLLVIPVVFLIVIFSVLFIFFSSIGFISSFITVILKLLTEVITCWVDFVNILPCAVIKDISLTFTEAFILMLLTWFTFSWLKFKKSVFLILSLATICFILVFNVSSKISCLSNHQIIVYHSKKELHIGIYSGSKNTFLTSADDIYSSKDYEFYLKKHWLRMGFDEKMKIRQLNKNKDKEQDLEKEIFSPVNLIKSRSGSNYMILRKSSQLLLKQNSITKLSLIVGENLLPPDSKCSIDLIIIPASINHFYSRQWIRYASENNICCFNIAESGAFVADL